MRNCECGSEAAGIGGGAHSAWCPKGDLSAEFKQHYARLCCTFGAVLAMDVDPVRLGYLNSEGWSGAGERLDCARFHAALPGVDLEFNLREMDLGHLTIARLGSAKFYEGLV